MRLAHKAVNSGITSNPLEFHLIKKKKKKHLTHKETHFACIYIYTFGYFALLSHHVCEFSLQRVFLG